MKRVLSRGLRSYVAGDSKGQVLIGKTIPAVLRETVEKHTGNKAVTEVSKKNVVTFDQLETDTNNMGTGGLTFQNKK